MDLLVRYLTGLCRRREMSTEHSRKTEGEAVEGLQSAHDDSEQHWVERTND